MIAKNSPYSGRAQSVVSSKQARVDSIRYVILANFTNLFPCYFCHVTLIGSVKSCWVRSSSFSIHVIRIVFNRAKPQVCRIYAIPSVAIGTIMQHARCFPWDWAKMYNPRSSVRQHHSVGSTSGDLSVSIGKCTTPPKPTRLSDLDFGKEPFKEGVIKTLLRKVFGAEMVHGLGMI